MKIGSMILLYLNSKLSIKKQYKLINESDYKL